MLEHSATSKPLAEIEKSAGKREECISQELKPGLFMQRLRRG